MAQTFAKSLSFPSLISRQLPEICRCPYRSFSTYKALRAEPEVIDLRRPAQRSQRSTQSIYQKYNRGGNGPQAPSRRGQGSEEYQLSPRMDQLMRQSRATMAARGDLELAPEPHHLHVYAHRHNTHVTLTRPNREPMLSISSGNIGFRHSSRGSYEAAYQLATYAMNKMLEKGMVQEIDSLELIMRGFGAGREAVQKALLSSEGRLLKNKVVRVYDATRLKFGGTRSKNVRRL